MSSFRFVHAADLHLDSPFVGLGRLPAVHASIVQELRQATFKAFDAVIDLCLSENVDFLLIAGDVYDGADRSLQAQLKFRKGLSRLSDAGIRAFVVHGNHDPLDGWAHSLEMPASTHVFGAELESVVFQKDGQSVARIHGISYPTKTIGKRFGQDMKREGDEPFQIGLFHCNAGGYTEHDPYAPRTVSELVDAGLDYWALGHVHERVVLRDSDPFIGYPGNTQGRQIRECGPRGCLLVNVTENGKLERPPEFVPTDAVRWSTAEIDISGLMNPDQLLSRIEESIDEVTAASDGRSVVVRLTLSGRGALHGDLSRPHAANDLVEELQSRRVSRTPFVWIEKLKLNTLPDIDLNARRGTPDFLGDLLRLIDEIRNSPEEVAALREVLTELYDHKRASRILESPNDDELHHLLDQAEICCVDLLAEDDC
ncbi:MAG: DNA repair exonuclease [Planctomycetota bacterium]|nr:DNA repair exonuclease [Planctomycetota bacterium]